MKAPVWTPDRKRCVVVAGGVSFAVRTRFARILPSAHFLIGPVHCTPCVTTVSVARQWEATPRLVVCISAEARGASEEREMGASVAMRLQKPRVVREACAWRLKGQLRSAAEARVVCW